jgi:hypothetical protein
MAMILVSTITVGTDSPSSIVFSNIPQTGKDLLLVVSARTTAPTSADCYITLNGSYTDTLKRLQGTGSAVSFTTGAPVFRINATSYTTSSFGNTSIYLANYLSTSSKSIFVDSVVENNASTADFSGIVSVNSSVSVPVTSMGIGYSAQFAQNSTASLYIIS